MLRNKQKLASRDARAVALFLAVTFALSGVCYYLYIRVNQSASALLMWCPGLAAILAERVFYPGENILGLRRCRAKINILSVGLPALYLLVSYGIYWLAFGWDLAGNELRYYPVAYLVSIPGTILTALGEEIGWRGFLSPRLESLVGVRKGVLLTGVVWAVWHFPLMIWGGYQAGAPLWYQLPLFTVEIVGVGVLMSFLRQRSGSVWPAALLHASHNYFDQLVFGPSTSGRLAPFLVGETGAVTAVAVIALAWFLVRNLYYDESGLFARR